MSRKIRTEYVDDIDGSALSSDEVEVVRFSIDGKDREIDLSPENAEDFRAFMKTYVDAGRPAAASSRRGAARSSVSAARKREENAKIRSWAIANGHPVARRGQIAQDVRDRYAAENGS